MDYVNISVQSRRSDDINPRKYKLTSTLTARYKVGGDGGGRGGWNPPVLVFVLVRPSEAR